ALLGRTQERLLFLKNLGNDLGKKLEMFRQMSTKKVYATQEPRSEASYRVVTGREAYYTEIKKIVRKANTEVLRILSALGLQQTKDLGLDKEYSRALKRGVSIRVIAEVNRENIDQARRLARIVELRHLEGINARFTVIDGRITILGHKFGDRSDHPSSRVNADDENYIVLSDMGFAEVSYFFFESLWKLATVPEFYKVTQRTSS
ncbi:MAG TPA: hypothetical protein VJN71_05435, partial [Nitrososphaerales archaeon]|nr:hypothetical protein [Nitrososphaerales archaeon]